VFYVSSSRFSAFGLGKNNDSIFYMEKPNTPMRYKENSWDEGTSVVRVMYDLKERIKPIVETLKEGIENDQYGMVLGVDASGRVPALVLARLIQYKRNIEIRFVTGNKNVDNEDSLVRLDELKGHFSTEEFRGQLGDREVLIVDDIIASGFSLELICRALKEVSLRYKVIGLAHEKSKTSASKEAVMERLEADILIGGEGDQFSGEYPEIYGKHQMAGIKKGVGMFSKSIHKTELDAQAGGNLYYPKQNQKVLQRTRELVNRTAHQLAEEIGWA